MLLTREQVALLSKPIQELYLPERLTNCLEQDGIYTIEDLLQRTPQSLLSLPNLGPKSLEEIYAKLARHGFVRQTTNPPSTPCRQQPSPQKPPKTAARKNRSPRSAASRKR